MCFEKTLEKSRIFVRKLDQDIVNDKFEYNTYLEGEDKSEAENLILTSHP